MTVQPEIHLLRLALPILLATLCLPGCDSTAEERSSNDSTVHETSTEALAENASPNPFVNSIESAHHRAEFMAHQVFTFDLLLSFGGKERLRGTCIANTNSSNVMLIRNDSTRLLFDGATIYRYPADTDWPRARFDALTWYYFFAAPFKLSDEGVVIEQPVRRPFNLDGIDSLDGAKMTFESGTGDAPDDWYVLYADPQTGLLRGMAYIVTFSKSAEEASADPHAILYSDYREVDGVPIAHHWDFYGWKPDSGFTSQLGEATISNVRFIEEWDFTLPEGRVEVGR